MPGTSTQQKQMAKPKMNNSLNAVCFNIAAEAAEKCEEIDVKCEEEFKVLQRKEISKQTDIIDTADKKRRDNVLRENRVFTTKLVNNSRLAQLQARNDVIADVKIQALKRLENEKGSKYSKLLTQLMVQALYSLMEPKVQVFCRSSERRIVTSCFGEVSNVYSLATRQSVTMEIGKNPLKDSVIGGVVVSTPSGRASVDCRIASRVENVVIQAMPEIASTLFANVGSMM